MLTMQGGPPAYHVLAKPTGPICNLDCEYCFFLSKEMLYPGDRFRMADEMLETYLRQLLESHRTPEVTVAWQGGEPTMMGLDFFRRSVELVDELRRPNQRIAYTIQTNGVLIDERWAAFFKENNFLVGVSVDGPRELHDRFRVDKRGEGSFDRVMAGYEHLRAAAVDVNVLCTIHAGNQDHPLDVYRFFRDGMGVEFIQFIPIVERATETLLPLANLGWSTRAEGEAAALRPGRGLRHRPQRQPGGVRAVPQRGVRRMDPRRRRRGLRAALRHGTGQLARRAAGGVRVLGDVRPRRGPGAQRRSVLV